MKLYTAYCISKKKIMNIYIYVTNLFHHNIASTYKREHINQITDNIKY